jgi:hypothetical protein
MHHISFLKATFGWFLWKKICWFSLLLTK